MKISRRVLLSAISVALVFGISNMQNDKVFGLTDNERYNTGYSWGCSDARKGGHPYLISHPTHTPIFMNGYDKGYASCSSGNTQTPSTASSVNRNNMFSDQNMCKSVQKYLIKPCSSYVKSNGVLTDEGIGAKRCISNGMLLSGVGLMGHLPPLTIIGILEPASEGTGCGGIVKWQVMRNDVQAATVFLTLLEII
jgi:hypothetical protein